MNVYGRSSAEEAAAARARSCGIGDGIWNKTNTEDEVTSEKQFPPSSRASKLSENSSSSIGIRSCGDNTEIPVFDDDDDSIHLNPIKSESSNANDSYASSLSASNYSFSAAVAPITSENINTTSLNKFTSLQEDVQQSYR